MHAPYNQNMMTWADYIKRVDTGARLTAHIIDIKRLNRLTKPTRLIKSAQPPTKTCRIPGPWMITILFESMA